MKKVSFAILTTLILIIYSPSSIAKDTAYKEMTYQELCKSGEGQLEFATNAAEYWFQRCLETLGKQSKSVQESNASKKLSLQAKFYIAYLHIVNESWDSESKDAQALIKSFKESAGADQLELSKDIRIKIAKSPNLRKIGQQQYVLREQILSEIKSALSSGKLSAPEVSNLKKIQAKIEAMLREYGA